MEVIESEVIKQGYYGNHEIHENHEKGNSMDIVLREESYDLKSKKKK